MAIHNFGTLLNHLAGRGSLADSSALDSEMAQAAQRLIDAGRRATTAAKPSNRLQKRALRIFRDHHRPESALSAVLRLVVDSLQGMAPAVRRAGGSSVRFLKFEGSIVVELQVSPDARGLELRGQVTVPNHAAEAGRAEDPVAVAANSTTAPAAEAASTMTSAGTVTAGAPASPTVTTNAAVPALPAVSVALQLTVVVPIPNVDPEAGAHVAVGDPSTASVEPALNVTGAPDADVASTMTSVGTDTTGGVVSCTSRV